MYMMYIFIQYLTVLLNYKEIPVASFDKPTQFLIASMITTENTQPEGQEIY
jgi:hypothetical protein